jgi:hypothetical protein
MFSDGGQDAPSVSLADKVAKLRSQDRGPAERKLDHLPTGASRPTLLGDR